MSYTNSSLISYTKISPNKTSPRNHTIDTITIHCMAGNLTIESCGSLFAQSSRQASSNYGIGTDGRIALYVEEKDRSWCSSNSANDHRAVTIEVANDGGAPDWHVSDKAMASLINLVADICKRNNIKELKWQADKSLIGQVTKQNMTVHRWFAAKACPGDYLYNNHSYIATEVNKKLGMQSNAATSTSSSTSSSTELYRVRKTWTDASSQIGAYSVLENAKAACKDGYSVFDIKGNVVYTNSSTTSSNTSSTTTSTKTKVTYMSHCVGNNNWCSEIAGYNTVNSSGYSGILGKAIDKFAIKLSQGTVTYAAHKKGGNWFNEVSGYSTTNSNQYAGATGYPIDAIIVKASGINGILKYRVHTKSDNKWWGWITGYSKTNSSQYAGVFGKEIDAIQIGIE